jgi:asparagine synthase (glutamine-hydrolysing)
VHAFAIGIGLDHEAAARLRRGVIDVGQEFRLDSQTLWEASSPTRALTAAGVHHSASAIGERRYVAFSEEEIAILDGLPLDDSGSLIAHDAEQLRRHWRSLPELLEGEFCAARIDLAAGVAEVLVDPLGMLPVFHAGDGERAVISTSAQIVASVLGLYRPDLLAVASFVALDWAMERRTFLAGVRALPGGCVHRLDAKGLHSNQHFGPASLIYRRKSRSRSAGPLAKRLERLTSAAASAGGPVRCALTAGRDTRLMAALLRSIGATATFYTAGAPDSADVVVARELAVRFGLDHEVQQARESQRDWTQAAVRFMQQTEGLSSLVQLVDYIELNQPVDRLGVTLWGVGGEIGRADSPLRKLSPNLLLLSRLPPVQRRLLALKINDHGLLTDDGRALVAQHLQSFAEERLCEGWPTRELSEAFYIFGRVACWGAGGVRRASGTSDLFSPFCTRPFMRYCLSLSPGERYLETPHHRLLSSIDPPLREHRFERPFPPQQSWLVAPLATQELWRTLRSGARRGGGKNGVPSDRDPPFLTRWLAARTGMLADIAEHADAEIWQVIDRRRVMALLRPGCPELPAYTKALLGALTPLWLRHTIDTPRATEERP